MTLPAGAAGAELAAGGPADAAAAAELDKIVRELVRALRDSSYIHMCFTRIRLFGQSFRPREKSLTRSSESWWGRCATYLHRFHVFAIRPVVQAP